MTSTHVIMTPAAGSAIDSSLVVDTQALPKTTDTGVVELLPAINIIEAIARLAALSPLEYVSVRIEQAKLFGWLTTVLDAEVSKAQNVDAVEVKDLPFPIVEPHLEAIEPAQLIDDVSNTIRKYIVLDQEQADAAALWIVLTWFIDFIEIAPLAIINAPEKACGKTQMLTVIGYMVKRALPASNASSSALFRAVEKWHPTMLIDEADTFFKDNPELQGMVNAGYQRGGFVLRSEASGDSFEPRMFSVFSAKAIAGIALEKHLPDATMSRALVFNLRRKMQHESVSRLRHADRMLFGDITAKLARFADDYAQQVKHARPILPESLSDRDQDNWEPLLAIAGCAGVAWLARATNAALKLSNYGEKSESTGNQLLADIQEIFENKRINRIRSVQLISDLIDDVEKPWATYNRGKPISPRQLAKLLSAYDISSKTVRFSPHDTPKGFELSQFQDAFARYLGQPEDIAHQGNEFHIVSNGEAEGVADVLQRKMGNQIAATLDPLPGIDIISVAEDIY